MFKKSMKRDASLFSNFKDRKFWDNWHRRTVATANAHDIEDVLNPDYSPVKSRSLHNLFLIRCCMQIKVRSMFDSMSMTSMFNKSTTN